MNTAALKSFAPAVRRQLMEAVGRKLDVVLAAQTPDLLTTYARQVESLRRRAEADRQGLVERVAYTWFNRLAALRYLDARGWHPFRARVLTPAAAEETQPELLRVVRAGEVPTELVRHVDAARLNDLLDGRIPSENPQGEVYRALVLAACRFYHSLLPDLFERLDDETELLLPDDLLTEMSVVQGFRTQVTDEDCAEVELLGWLYQFYISEKKDAVMGRKSAVPSEDIPAVTQLFTPHWIVRYLVENSLGRLWLLNRPGSGLRAQMPYYIEGEAETDFLRVATPQEIRIIDPAVGSGHMLTYAFDLLFAIYEEEGYAPSEIPGLILRHNLFGVDIDPRAAQLASLALVLKARERSRRFFQREVLVRPNVIALQDVHFSDHELREYVDALDLGALFSQPVLELLRQFEHATTFGSLTQPVLGETDIQQLRREVEAKDLGGELFLSGTHQKVLRVLEQAEYLTQRYHVAVANPPYMGMRGMGQPLRGLLEALYPRAKYDLYTAFIRRSSLICEPRGYTAMVTMQGWLFLSSFTAFREDVFHESTVICLAQLGARAFDSITGEVVQTTCFVLKRGASLDYPALYVDATVGKNEAEKAELVRNPPATFSVTLRDIKRVESWPLAYWLSEKARDAFANGVSISMVAKPRQGLATSNNGRFLRYWSEVSISRVGFGMPSRVAAKESGKGWFPLVKGGAYRKWYGNNDHLVNWENDGQEMIALAADLYGSPTRTVKNMEFYFREGITWSTIANRFAMRYSPSGAISETKGAMCFSDDRDDLMYLLGFANTYLVESFLKVFSPTLDFHEGPFGRLPFVRSANANQVRENVEECIRLEAVRHFGSEPHSD